MLIKSTKNKKRLSSQINFWEKDPICKCFIYLYVHISQNIEFYKC